MDGNLKSGELLHTILSQGVKLSPKEIEDADKSLNRAIREGTIASLEKDGNKIGFFTWQDKDGEILINNLLVLKQFKNKNNLFYLRKIFRRRFPDAKKFYWKNRKRDKQVNIY